MRSKINDSFDNNTKYRLYRDVYEIMHPTISKKNVSNYKIILREDLIPVEVFYPEKGFKLEKIMIYVHGSSSITNCDFKYADLCSLMSTKTKRLVIALDYQDGYFMDTLKEVSKTISFLEDELVKNGLVRENITLIGDDIGSNILMGIMNNNLVKKILLCPLVSGNYFLDSNVNWKCHDLLLLHNISEYFKKTLKSKREFKSAVVFPGLSKSYKLENCLLIVGNNDPLKDEVVNFYQNCEKKDSSLVVIDFMGHNFFNNLDSNLNEALFTNIDLFLDGEKDN